MTKSHRTSIIPIGNSKGIRIPKDYLNALGETQVLLEKTEEGILIKPLPVIPPLNEWEALFAKEDNTLEPDLADWNTTLSDGLQTEAPYEQ